MGPATGVEYYKTIKLHFLHIDTHSETWRNNRVFLSQNIKRLFGQALKESHGLKHFSTVSRLKRSVGPTNNH